MHKTTEKYIPSRGGITAVLLCTKNRVSSDYAVYGFSFILSARGVLQFFLISRIGKMCQVDNCIHSILVAIVLYV